jgi:hypothetical protein
LTTRLDDIESVSAKALDKWDKITQAITQLHSSVNIPEKVSSSYLKSSCRQKENFCCKKAPEI